MLIAPHITNYLPAAIIVLLLATVATLAWRLMQAVRRRRVLERSVEELQMKLMEKEKRGTDGEEKGKDSVQTSESEEIALSKQDEVPDNVFVTHVDQLITRNIAKSEFTASTIAQVMHLSRPQLDRRMKQLTQKTTTAYLMDRRMTHARELLLTTDMPIAEVAIACGFDDTSYFTRVFKQHYESTPSGMRS